MLVHFLQTFGLPLAFVLLPLALYLLTLANLNRRQHPVLVPGSWDAVGTLFAASGLLLVFVPFLFDLLYRRAIGSVTEEGMQGLPEVWSRFGFVWLVYYLGVAAGSLLLITWRGGKTMVYNVDPERLVPLLGRALERLQLTLHASGQDVVIAAPETGFSAGPLPRHPDAATRAGITLDSFPAGHHVTIDWKATPKPLRRSIKDALRAELQTVTTPDNATAGLLLIVSGFLFGLIALIAFLHIVAPLLRRF